MSENPITRYQHMVEEILWHDAKARDNDRYLVCEIIKKWLKSKNIIPGAITGNDLLRILSDYSDAPNFESIRRVRQKVQEDNPTLRGKQYSRRHARIEDVRKDLGYNDPKRADTIDFER